MYPYDTFDEADNELMTLRGGREEVRKVLERELQERYARAGIKVIEARISHLSYAKEIAETMLKRQQAQAVVAARKQIVNGAVGMVEMALERLEQRNTVQLSEDKKASMVSNLLVVLCSENSAHPTVGVGI